MCGEETPVYVAPVAYLRFRIGEYQWSEPVALRMNVPCLRIELKSQTGVALPFSLNVRNQNGSIQGNCILDVLGCAGNGFAS